MFERFEIEIFEFASANFLFDLSDYQEALESFTRLVKTANRNTVPLERYFENPLSLLLQKH